MLASPHLVSNVSRIDNYKLFKYWNSYSVLIKTKMKRFTLLICLFFIHFAYAELTYTPIEGGYEVSGGYNLSGPVVIPDTYNGQPVIKIPHLGFSGQVNITSITLPSTLRIISEEAFSGCSNLRHIYMPDTLDSIGGEAFQNCSSLLSVDIPLGVSVIEPNTFRGCTSLQSVNLPNGILEIRYNAFYLCDSLVYIQLPTSLETIETPLNADNLQSIIFTGNAPSITAPTIASSGTVYHLENATGFTTSTWAGRPVATYSSYNTFSTVADFLIQADVDQNETDADSAIANIQADVDQNETDSDSADSQLQSQIDANTLAITNLQNAISNLIDDAILTILSDPQSYGLYTEEQLVEARTGSTLINIENEQAVISMNIEQSEDLNNWTTKANHTVQIPIENNKGKQFYRFQVSE